jgi:uncharacterized protein (TIGR02145 family)
MKYYKYSLIHATKGTLELDHAPQEWSSDQSFWERSMTYWGVFRSFSTKELTIIREGAVFLKLIYDLEGTEALCSYQVEALDTSDYSYSIIYTGIIDFSTYKYFPSVPGYFDVVKVEIIDDTFVNKIKTRESDEVSLAKLVSIDNTAITPFTYEGKSIKVPSRTDTYYAKYSGFLTDVSQLTLAFGLLYAQREDECAINVIDNLTDPAGADAAFFKALYSTAISINLFITGTVVYSASGSIELNFKRYNADGTLMAIIAVGTYYTVGTNYTITLDIDETKTIASIAEGDYIVLEAIYSSTPDSVNLIATNPGTSEYTNFTYTKLVFVDSYFYGYFYHEAFTRILQALTGEASPFYSDKLGRTDSELDTYAADGDMSLGVVTNGYLLRGFELDDTDISLNVSLKDLFLSLHSTTPLSLGIETIGGVKKVRIEELRRAFQDVVFLSIDNAIEINEEVANDLTFSSISIGFSKAELAYNKIKGRYEYNTKVEYSTVITRQKQDFSQVSPCRGDTNAIVGCLTNNKNDKESEDTNYDDNNFIISIVRDSVLQIKRAEGYATLGGLDNSAHSYNLDYQPARNLRHWGSFLSSCVRKYLTSILSFIKSDKSSGAYTKKTTETKIVYEGKDIAVTDLDYPFFDNIYYSFDFVVTNDVIKSMGESDFGIPNVYKKVRFRNNKNDHYRYGWIMKLESRKADNKGFGTFKLLKSRAGIEFVTESTGTVSFDLTGTCTVVIDWGDGTTTTILLTSTEQTVTHTYTDGEAEHTIIISNPQCVTTIDASSNDLTDFTVPPEATQLEEIILDDNNIPGVDPVATWPGDVITDDEGNIVDISEVTIGDQTWMTKNWSGYWPGFKTYNMLVENKDEYGGLYTFAQIMSSGFCPAGWRIPTEDDWNALIAYIGGVTGGAGKLKEIGTTHWTTPNTDAADDYDFAAIGGGYASKIGAFLNLKDIGYLWSATDGNTQFYAKVIKMSYDSGDITIANGLKLNYYSLRLIKGTTVNTITDVDGNVYTYVTIGTQQWLVENLRTTKYADGTPIPNLTLAADWIAEDGSAGHDGAYCYYDNDVANKATYGALYNWHAVNNAHGLAIAGWRVPSDADWSVLTTFLGTYTIVGGKLKEAGTTHWTTPNTGATDDYGFKALPGGERTDSAGAFDFKGIANYLWKTNATDATKAHMEYMLNNSASCLSSTAANKKKGSSIRLMRDI